MILSDSAVTSESDSDMEELVKEPFNYKRHLIYMHKSAVSLNNEVRNDSFKYEWPPTVNDFNLQNCKKTVPMNLFHHLCWIRIF